ncbi:MAG: hypothetical protein R6W68_15075 [Ignavibacteriaceae bacterium]
MSERVFIGYNNIVSLGTLLKKGFNHLNIEADFYSTEKNRSVYDYYGNEEFFILKFSKIKLTRYLQSIFFLLKIALKYKYFIFIQRGGLLTNYKDIRFLKLIGKKTAIVFAGCDIRMPEKVAEFKWNPCSNCTVDYQTMVNCDIAKKKNELKSIEKYFDFIFSPDECAGFIKRKYYSHYFPVDFEYIAKYKVKNIKDSTSPFTILHAPSNYHIKGTAFIEKTIEDIKKKYPNILYKRLQGLPKTEIIKEINNADMVIDQMLVGFYGVLAVEAMALEKPVVCYIRPDLWKNMKDSCPIINADPENLEEVLESLIKDQSALHELGHRSRQYALEYHSPQKTAEIMLRIFREKN